MWKIYDDNWSNAPQENDVTKEEMNKMYKWIEDEINVAKTEKHIVLIGGDFNCKVGDIIMGNKKEITKGGRRLVKIAQNNGMKILNTTEKCHGTWTRTQEEKNGTKKSVLDYVLITEEHEQLVQKMTIDEEKQNTPFRDDSTPGRKTYTDHNMITIEINIQIESNKDEEIKISRNNMENFEEATQKSNLQQIWEQNKDLKPEEKYTKWNDKVIEILRATCGKKKKKRKERKEIRIMRQKRKMLKVERRKENKQTKRSILKRRRDMIQHHIIRNIKRDSGEKTIKTARKIMNKGVFNGTAYWEFKKSMHKPTKIKGTSVDDKDGKRVDEPEKVKEVYKEFYKDLLTTKKAETEEEIKVEKTVNKCIEAMEELKEHIEIELMTDEEYENMKNSLKKEKAPDMQGWFYEMIIHAGKDLEESIKLMIRTMMKTKAVADEWNRMCIQPIDKTSGWLEMKMKRGLFLTNIISKCVEKILFKRRENTLIENISPYQNGGLTHRGIQDNLFVFNHTINKYRKEGKNLYLLFSDIEKCFDNLWLRDCILELIRCGTPIEEAMYIFQMNKKVFATIRTPVGDTEEIELEEIVRQGTVGGNKLCIVSTDRINRMGRYLEIDGIRFPVFVDDKIGMGNTETLEEMNWRMRILEITKKYKYNNKKGKTEWMMIRNNRRKNEEEEVQLEVNSGMIEEQHNINIMVTCTMKKELTRAK